MRIDLAPTHAIPRLHDAGPTLTLVGRLGYAAKGVVYVVIGALAARAALGRGGRTTDSTGALAVIGDGPMGTATLVVIAIGLFGYMAWRLVAAVTDAEGKGDKPTSLAVRAAQAGRGVVYGALGVQAARLAKGHQDPGGDAARDWTNRVLDLPAGPWIVGGVGLGIIGYAVYQLYRAMSAKRVRKHLDLSRAGPTLTSLIVHFGQFGIAARAVVFAMIGLFFVRAARQHDPSEAGGMAESLRALAGGEYGVPILASVAAGLIAYGLYQLATARYRRMRAVGHD